MIILVAPLALVGEKAFNSGRGNLERGPLSFDVFFFLPLLFLMRELSCFICT